MFNFKKISAILTSAVMIGSSVGFAAAASFPSGFTSTTPAIVYGASADSSDSVAANSISSYLAGKVTSTTGTPTGESIMFDKSATKFHVGRSLLNVKSNALTDSDLPTLLADGVYVDDDNDEFDYTQKIEMANLNITMFENSEYKSNEPTIGVTVANSGHVLNYSIDFTDEPLWADLATTDLKLLGKNYYILSITNGTTLNLLDAASTSTLAEGESTTLTVNGASYEVSLDFVGSSTARFTVNGVASNSLAAGETQKISGAYIGVKSIDSQQYAGGVKKAEFAIGSGKLKIVSDSEVELNDVKVDKMKVHLTSGYNAGTTLSKIQMEWKAQDDTFITEVDPKYDVMPGFAALKLSYIGTFFPKEESIKIAQSDQYIYFDDFPLKNGVADINLIYGNQTQFNGTGKSDTDRLRTTNESELKLTDEDDRFILSYNDGTTAESYLMKYSITESTDWKNKTTFSYWNDGAWKSKDVVSPGETLDLGSASFVVSFAEDDNEDVYINVTGSSNFNELFSAEGLRIYLPYANSTPVSNNLDPGYLNVTVAKLDSTTFTLQVFEEDREGNIDNTGGAFNVTIGWDSSSTKEAEITDVVGESATFKEIESSNVYRSIIYSALATELLWTKPDSSQKTLEIKYHGDESYGKLYLTDATSGATTAGNMIFTDADKTSWQDKNVILVGGTCINSATATALDSTIGTCGADWVTVTGVRENQYLIKVIADKFTTGKIALVAAGYNAADTRAAASRLTNDPASIDTTTGNAYIYAVGAEGTSTIVSGP